MGLGNLLETTAKLHHESEFSYEITLQSALTSLHDHNLLIKMDPNLVSYTSTPSSPSSPNTKLYTVLDKMEHIPKALWSQEVHLNLEYTDLADGIHTTVKAPLGLLMDTFLKLEEREGKLVLIEDVEIRCSRLLMPFVKGDCEANWKGIHKRFMEGVREREEGVKKGEGEEKVGVVQMEAVGTPIVA